MLLSSDASSLKHCNCVNDAPVPTLPLPLLLCAGLCEEDVWDAVAEKIAGK